jgi:hypothetical protein
MAIREVVFIAVVVVGMEKGKRKVVDSGQSSRGHL